MASWITPMDQAVGDIITAAIWNQNVVDNSTFLAQAPYIRAYNTITTAPSGIIQITLGGTAYSGHGIVVSSNNVVVPIAGIYQVNYQVEINNGAGTGVLFGYAYQNGAAVSETAVQGAASGILASAGSCLVKCAASDTIGLYFAGANASAVTTNTGVTHTFLDVSFRCLV